MKKAVQLVCLMLAVHALHGQQFINGGLEGSSVYGQFDMQGWTNVPYTDSVCLANEPGRDSPDILAHDSPGKSYGINGDPHSGKTFASGNHAQFGSSYFQEGIMQQIDHLVPGKTYQVILWQAVVKQQNLQDNSGSWAVYADNTLLGITRPTHSNAAFDANDLKWEKRSITFIPTASSHWIKFLPMDDDDNHSSSGDDHDGLRMGIDDIAIIGGAGLTVSVTPSPLANMAQVQNESGTELTLDVINSENIAVKKGIRVPAGQSMVSLDDLPTGTFTLKFSLGDDVVNVEFDVVNDLPR